VRRRARLTPPALLLLVAGGVLTPRGGRGNNRGEHTHTRPACPGYAVSLRAVGLDVPRDDRHRDDPELHGHDDDQEQAPVVWSPLIRESFHWRPMITPSADDRSLYLLSHPGVPAGEKHAHADERDQNPLDHLFPFGLPTLTLGAYESARSADFGAFDLPSSARPRPSATRAVHYRLGTAGLG
jgi:hypothetical protein